MSTTPNDPINPSHYKDGKIEVIDFIEDKNLGFNPGNAVKYIARAGKKDPTKTIEDLQKAKWYIEREIQRLHTANESSSIVRTDIASAVVANGPGTYFILDECQSILLQKNDAGTPPDDNRTILFSNGEAVMKGFYDNIAMESTKGFVDESTYSDEYGYDNGYEQNVTWWCELPKP